MIQRIQSLYLLGGAIAALLCFLVLPFATFTEGEIIIKLTGLGLESTGDEALPKYSLAVLPGILTALLSVFFLMTLFNFRNRKRQLRFLLVTMLINLLLIGAIFLVAGRIDTLLGFSEAPGYGIGTYLTLLTIILIVLANRGIRKDEALIRSADRLR